MNKETKQKWVKALRSGRYKQTKSVLKNNTGYCCLGVLCRILGVKANKINGQMTTGAHNFIPKFSERVGIKHRTEGILADFNDQGISFEWIADYIERRL